MTTPEGRVKDKIKALLKQYGAYYHMPVMNGLGAPTVDFICCHNGRFFAIEAKAGNKQPTKRQEITLNEIAFAGGFIFVVNAEQGLDVLEVYLQLVGG
jgi:hypothetical protein